MFGVSSSRCSGLVCSVLVILTLKLFKGRACRLIMLVLRCSPIQLSVLMLPLHIARALVDMSLRM